MPAVARGFASSRHIRNVYPQCTPIPNAYDDYGERTFPEDGHARFPFLYKNKQTIGSLHPGRRFLNPRGRIESGVLYRCSSDNFPHTTEKPDRTRSKRSAPTGVRWLMPQTAATASVSLCADDEEDIPVLKLMATTFPPSPWFTASGLPVTAMRSTCFSAPAVFQAAATAALFCTRISAVRIRKACLHNQRIRRQRIVLYFSQGAPCAQAAEFAKKESDSSLG